MIMERVPDSHLLVQRAWPPSLPISRSFSLPDPVAGDQCLCLGVYPLQLPNLLR